MQRLLMIAGASPATLSVVRDVEFALAEEQNCWWGIELNPTHAIKVTAPPEYHQQRELFSGPDEFTKTAWNGHSPLNLMCACVSQLVNGLENHQHDSSVELALSGVDNSEYLQGACLQIAVLTTHQQGRDTHIRQVLPGVQIASLCLRCCFEFSTR